MKKIGEEQNLDVPISAFLGFLYQAILKRNQVRNNAILDHLELTQASYNFEAINYLDKELRKNFW